MPTIRPSLCAPAAMLALCAFVVAPNASAQTPCFTNTGPDLIVSDIAGTANYASQGGIEAFAAGMNLYNIGTVWADFFASTNRHPVAGSGFFRLKNVDGASRFEQVGVSWLHHGFFALSQGGLCVCTPTDGEHLGVGCSDPSTASRQGTQGGLGPRWQVNAHTGDFVYPPANPAWNGTVARRLQVAISDLEVTGSPNAARYFVEKHVIAPDDATVGNDDNNASTREIVTTTAAGEWTFVVSGPTRRESAAIRTWRLVDPSVQEVDVHVPGEGLFVLAARATDLGNGQWHYEYALYNQNSDLSAQSFALPLPAGVTVTNIGFHDVDYHSGDGIANVTTSGLDWTTFMSGGQLAWAGETFAQNPNANALRWGTLYNFRFDADSPPELGTVTIGLFKSSASVTAMVDVPSGNMFSAFCFGDGSATACPCGNSGLPGHGCANSVNPAGALLGASGQASLAADTLVLAGSDMPDASVLYFQGTSRENGGAGTVFGDGLRCASGVVVRLATKLNVLGISQYPGAGDPPVSVRGSITLPGTRTYQCWYRNAASFCTSAAFNLSNGLEVLWTP